jgi:hypothetical protein
MWHQFVSWEITRAGQYKTILSRKGGEKMRKTIKRVTCIALFFFLLAPLAFAESEYVQGWVDTWTVKMNDNSIVTWEITDTWVSESGKSHIAYGIKNPDNVEFQIYYSLFFSKHYYIEASHDKTVYDLPQDFAEYTQLVPSDDFKSFTAKEGKYPISSGYKGTVEPEPDTCVASYLLGADDPRLDTLRRYRDEKLALSRTGRDIIMLYYYTSDAIIAVCEKNPAVKRSLKLMLESVILGIL